MPAIPLHGEEAAADQSQDKGGVGVNMEGLVGPGLKCLNGSTDFGNVVRQTGAYEVEGFREATGGEPCSACCAVGMAFVEGGTICPDVLPIGRHSTWVGEGRGGRGSVFLEETFIGEVIAKSVRPGEQGLG